jgi:hypothetical protein
MKPLPSSMFALICVSLLTGVWGCRRNDRQDTVITSAANPSHTYRATIILRQYFVDGKIDTSPTTYVVLDADTGKPNYENGVEFKDSQVVMKPSQCGPMSVEWANDHMLKVICEKCGLALSGAGQHANTMGAIQVEYEGFPAVSSWESGPRAN